MFKKRLCDKQSGSGQAGLGETLLYFVGVNINHLVGGISAPTGEQRAGRGTRSAHHVNEKGLFIGVNINHLAGGIGESLKVKFRNDKVLLFGSKTQL